MSLLDLFQRLPLREWKKAKRRFRRLFPHDWPEDVPHVWLPDNVDVLEATLRTAHYEDASGWSLYYEGEILNMRRPAGRAEDGTPLEDHLRVRRVDVDDDSPLERYVPALECNGHREPSRWEAKTAHVESERVEWFDAKQLAGLLEDAGIPADVITTP